MGKYIYVDEIGYQSNLITVTMRLMMMIIIITMVIGMMTYEVGKSTTI